jgi:hemerythrin-like domain-containing protein
MMRLLEQLRRDHELIDDLAGALWTWAQRCEAGDADVVEDGSRFAQVLEHWVEGVHHRNEEQVLFTALVERAEVPGERGPLAVLRREHREMQSLGEQLDAAEAEVAATAARRLARLLWEHVDKENSVLFPEAEQRLVRGGVRELEPLPRLPDGDRARELAEELLVRYPPGEDPDMVRGEGCIACSAFTVDCAGIEGEWWNLWERAYQRSLDEG